MNYFYLFLVRRKHYIFYFCARKFYNLFHLHKITYLHKIYFSGLSADSLVSTKPKLPSHPNNEDQHYDVTNNLRASTRDTLATRVESIKKSFDAKLHGYLSGTSIAHLWSSYHNILLYDILKCYNYFNWQMSVLIWTWKF